ncbi:MAG: DUF4167 domain-containing protein [Holosporales bacterium]|nr:DUF4167 domain-containing protein [Holosporales bacterium]
MTAKMKFNGKKSPQKFQKQNLDQQKQRNQSLYAKHLALGKDAASQGDNVEAERNFQQAEHYIRLLNDITALDVNSSIYPVNNETEQQNEKTLVLEPEIVNSIHSEPEEQKEKPVKTTCNKTLTKPKYSRPKKSISIDVSNSDNL